MKKFAGVIIAVILLAFFIQDASAIPAFARRYKLSCNTCHSPIPRLKPYGDEFAGNGFILKEEEKERDYITAGDDMLWLNKDFPVGVRFDAYAQYDQDQDVDKDLQSPWGIKLLSGGTVYKNIGYYFYFYMSERGEVAGIEDAYLHFDNVGGSQLDILVGQFQTSDPLMKRELRLTFEDYAIYKTSIGSSSTNLAYDRGVMFMYGLEQTGTDIIAMVVNGNGKDEAGDDKKFDNDANKNLGFRVAQGIGELVSIGGYYYLGKETMLNYLDDKFENEITYIGVDGHMTAGPLAFTGQWLRRKDTNPYFAYTGMEYEGEGIVAELVISPQLDRSRFYLTALYNRIDHDIDAYDYQTATLSGTYLVARNLRLIAEYTRDLELDKNRVTIGLVSGF